MGTWFIAIFSMVTDSRIFPEKVFFGVFPLSPVAVSLVPLHEEKMIIKKAAIVIHRDKP
jgi:hypothetical protein